MQTFFQLTLFLFGIALGFLALWQVDFHSFMRKNKIDFSIFVYIVLSIALGSMIGIGLVKLFELVGNLF